MESWSRVCVCVCVCFAGPLQLNWIEFTCCCCFLWVLCGLHNLDRHIDGGLLFLLQSVQVGFVSRRAVIRGDEFFRLRVLLDVPTLLFIWSASHDQGLWVLDLFPFSWRSALCGGFFICEDLGPSLLYFFPPPWLGAKFYWWLLVGFHHFVCSSLLKSYWVVSWQAVTTETGLSIIVT
jgi:hypothetical protein